MSSDLGGLSTALADRYRIERELGAGGMATVYLAHDVLSPDGQRFVMVRSTDAVSSGTPLHVVLHWFDQLRAQRR